MSVLKIKGPEYYQSSLLLPVVGTVEFDSEGNSPELDDNQVEQVLETHGFMFEVPTKVKLKEAKKEEKEAEKEVKELEKELLKETKEAEKDAKEAEKEAEKEAKEAEKAERKLAEKLEDEAKEDAEVEVAPKQDEGQVPDEIIEESVVEDKGEVTVTVPAPVEGEQINVSEATAKTVAPVVTKERKNAKKD